LNWILAGVLAYVALQLAVGVLVSRRIASEADYLVAGRRLGYPLAVFSIFATWFGAETCVGAAGAVYEEGLGATSADPFGYGVCLVVMGLVLAAPLWKRKLLTLADLYRQRFSPQVERAAAVLLIPTSVLWASAQIRAFGQVLDAAAPALGFDAAVAIATGVVLIYTVSGGLLADAVTDVVQGIALIIGLAVVLGGVLSAAGGLAAAWDSIPGERLSFGVAEHGWLAVANAWALPIGGSLFAQELIARVSASRSVTVARRSSLAAAAIYIAAGSVPVLLGLVAVGLLAAPPADPEQVLPLLASEHLNAAGHVLFSGALVSAILSTVDSTLLTAGSLASHNLLVPAVPGASEAFKLRAARIGVVIAGLAAWGLALASDSVMGILEETNGFGSAGIVVISLFGLFTHLGGARAALASLAAGIAAWVAFHFLWEQPRWDYLSSLAAALAAYVLVAAFEGGGSRGGSRGPSVPAPGC
jgi:Na+/proline symporter